MNKALDDVLWARVRAGAEVCHLAVFDPFLYDGTPSAGKLMYSTAMVYGTSSIAREGTGRYPLYRAAYRAGACGVEPTSDEEIVQAGVRLGLHRGVGLDVMLNSFAHAEVEEWLPSPPMLDVDATSFAKGLSDELAQFYGCPPSSLRLTGGLALFGGAIESAHDVDVVVPLVDKAQIARLSRQPVPHECRNAVEFGLKWPLRWHARCGALICPFFVYTTEVPPPVVALSALGETCGEVIVRDVLYGLANAAVYLVDGEVAAVMFRATLVRGLIRPGTRLRISAPTFTVTNGAIAGASLALVTNPHDSTENFREVLDVWRP